MRFTSLLSSLKRLAWSGAQTRRNCPSRKPSCVLRLEILEDRALLSTLTVLNNLDSGAGSLRDAIQFAQSSDTIVFAPSLNGQTITLTSGELTIEKDLDIEGPGASLLAISGNDSSRVFDIRSAASVIIAGLTITHGRVTATGPASQTPGGGGIRNEGNLTLRDDLLSHNQALGSDQASWTMGGAVLNFSGKLTVTDSTFVGNIAIGINGGHGGAIVSTKHSWATVARSTFIENQAKGADGGIVRGSSSAHGDIGIGQGGAITNTDGSVMTVDDCTFAGNQAIGGNGADAALSVQFSFPGLAIGGAISNHDASELTLRRSTFAVNQAIGGSGINGGRSGHNFLGVALGGALFNEGTVNVSDALFDRNVARGGSGNTRGNPQELVSAAYGGAIDSVAFFGPGTLIVSNSIFTGNQAIGGQGSAQGSGGTALGGAIAVRNGAISSVSASVFSGNQAVGGNGGAWGNGGDALGGAFFVDGGTSIPEFAGAPSSLTVRRSTITHNRATGGTAGSGGSAGRGIGGGLYIDLGGTAYADMFTRIRRNLASSCNDDVFGILLPI
jgi:hypothetical protein